MPGSCATTMTDVGARRRGGREQRARRGAVQLRVERDRDARARRRRPRPSSARAARCSRGSRRAGSRSRRAAAPCAARRAARGRSADGRGRRGAGSPQSDFACRTSASRIIGRTAFPARSSSTHSAASRTVRPSAASAVASTSTMSALRESRIGCRRARARARAAPTRRARRAPTPGIPVRRSGRTRRRRCRDGCRRRRDPAISSACGRDVGGAAAAHVVERDDGDARVRRAPRVGDGVGEVGDAELHDPRAGRGRPRRGAAPGSRSRRRRAGRSARRS